MGAFQAGFSMGQRAYEHALAQKRQEEVDARRKVMEKREDDAYNAEQNLKLSMANAAKPEEVQAVTPTYQPAVDDEGNPMPANPTEAGGFRVGAQQFADRAAADKHVAEYNAHPAQMARVAGVLKGAGQIDKALDMEGRSRRSQLDEMQLKQAQWLESQTQRQRRFGKAIGGGPQGIVQFYNDDVPDGNRAEIIPGEGGKFDVVLRNKDGGELERKSYANADDFTRDAFHRIAMETDVFAGIKLKDDNEERVAKKEERKDNKLFRERVQTSVEKVQDAQIANMQETRRLQQLEIERRAAGDSHPGQIDIGVIDKEIDSLLGGKDADGNPIKPDIRARQAIRALAYRSPEAAAGDLPGATIAATRAYREALDKSGGDHDQAMQRIAIQMDMAASGTPGAVIQLGKGKPETVGVVDKTPPAKPQAKPGAPAPSMVRAAAQTAAQEPPEGAALDAARQNFVQAQKALNSYGSIQRQKDPKGFEQAKAAVAAAKSELASAEKAWQGAASRMVELSRTR